MVNDLQLVLDAALTAFPNSLRSRFDQWIEDGRSMSSLEIGRRLSALVAGDRPAGVVLANASRGHIERFFAGGGPALEAAWHVLMRYFGSATTEGLSKVLQTNQDSDTATPAFSSNPAPESRANMDVATKLLYSFLGYITHLSTQVEGRDASEIEGKTKSRLKCITGPAQPTNQDERNAPPNHPSGKGEKSLAGILR